MAVNDFIRSLSGNQNNDVSVLGAALATNATLTHLLWVDGPSFVAFWFIKWVLAGVFCLQSQRQADQQCVDAGRGVGNQRSADESFVSRRVKVWLIKWSLMGFIVCSLNANQIIDIWALGAALAINITLTHLEYVENLIFGIVRFVKCFVCSLGYNQISDVSTLGSALATNTTLTHLE